MVRPTSKVPHDAEMIPELAVRGSTDENYHVGVGEHIYPLLEIKLAWVWLLTGILWYSAAAREISTSTKLL
jgi:hypothetical protein